MEVSWIVDINGILMGDAKCFAHQNSSQGFIVRCIVNKEIQRCLKIIYVQKINNRSRQTNVSRNPIEKLHQHCVNQRLGCREKFRTWIRCVLLKTNLFARSIKPCSKIIFSVRQIIKICCDSKKILSRDKKYIYYE